MCCPSATLAVWSSAWLHGAAASDNVLDALLSWGEAHEVVSADDATGAALDLPVTGGFPAQPAHLLGTLRRLGVTDARLVLPVPGDVRGLGGGGELPKAALAAGEAVVLPGAGYGIVPHHIAEGLVRWTVHPLATAGPATPQDVGLDHVSIAEAEHGLTDAIRDSAGALQALDVASDRPSVRAELSAHLRARPAPDWPDGTPARALRVLQRAEEIGAILEVATAEEPGGALSASAAERRADALRPLSEAVRTARCAAVNEAVRVFADQANRR
ncbi:MULTISPECIES: hypothetical protein [Prauserella salsuginis group]|uniref:Uncharacterized protein n=2 Tax=Prauserella salsuginis group TaxID=2893672 RepID=A0A839XSR2_9PSEU|nr:MULTISPECIES: hypothetical protein [Prauserella salsuginis group]MBB3666240.1 hypothetical protein [Prauserella sediminis]